LEEKHKNQQITLFKEQKQIAKSPGKFLHSGLKISGTRLIGILIWIEGPEYLESSRVSFKENGVKIRLALLLSLKTPISIFHLPFGSGQIPNGQSPLANTVKVAKLAMADFFGSAKRHFIIK